MPSTVNGIGTHYYGQKNLQNRPGPCPHCGRNVQLSSYDTRLWFVVLFIPVIPLGRKRIVDKCPSCSRHYVVDLDKWETSKQLEISGAEETFRRQPTPENAIALHQQLAAFRQFEDAANLRERATAQFPDSAQMHASFADVLVHYGRDGEAAPLYERAHALRPDLPAARIGVAHARIAANQLDEARALLDFLEKPGASQVYSLAALETLAQAYQRAQRHAEALQLFARLLEELPHVADHAGFRTMVEKSEKAVGAPTKLLPKKKFSWRNFLGRNPGAKRSNARSLLIVGVCAALVLLGFVIANEVIRRHRNVYVVNAHTAPATVEITGPANLRLTVKPKRHETVVLPEGRYHAVINGPLHDELDFEVRAAYFDRWSEDPAWVLNVGGDAILMHEVVVYRRNPPPSTLTLHFGKNFEGFAKVTHAFTSLPQTVQLKEGESKVLAELETYERNGPPLFDYLLRNESADRALSFAESWLHTHPADEGVLHLYAETAQQQHAVARADAYLRPTLEARPVRIEWHRAYQSLHDSPAEAPAQVAEYDRLLAAAPTDSALLYLRGRVDPTRDGTRAFFERSIQADPANPYPKYGLGYDAMAAGEWGKARDYLGQVVALRKSDRNFGQIFVAARIASGEAPAVAQESRETLQKSPGDEVATRQLMDALAAQGAPAAEIMKVDAAFATVLKKNEDRKFDVERIHRYALYVCGDFAALEKSAANSDHPADQYVRAEALIELGRLADAEKVLAKVKDDDDSQLQILALAVAWQKSGHPAEANRWLERSRKIAAADGKDSVATAAWLDGHPPTAAAARDVAMSPRYKAMLLLAVVTWHPETANDLVPLIRQLNAEYVFPYQFIRRATAPGA